MCTCHVVVSFSIRLVALHLIIYRGDWALFHEILIKNRCPKSVQSHKHSLFATIDLCAGALSWWDRDPLCQFSKPFLKCPLYYIKSPELPIHWACYERMGRVASRPHERVHSAKAPPPPRLCRKGALVALGRVSSDNATKRHNRGGFSRMYAFIL